MAQTIRIRRGTKTELSSYGALATAELGFCTDTREVFIGDGASNILVGRAMSGTLVTRPAPATNGRFYFVTSGEGAGYIYFDDGTAWRRVNTQLITDLVGTLDDVLDGSVFKRIRAQDVTDGHVNKVSDGVNSKNAAEIKGHIDDQALHRTINDGGVSFTDLWSAQKIKSEIFNAIEGMDWQDSVKSKAVTSPPSSPALRDRYLIPEEATNQWTGRTGQIADWDGTEWEYFVPALGCAVYVEDESKNYTYNNSGLWVVTGGANQTIQAGNGLTGGGAGDTVVINVGAGKGISVAAEDVSVVAYHGITVDSNGVSVSIDNNTIQFDSANSNRLIVVNIDGGTFSS